MPRLQVTQKIPRPLEEVFLFFADAKNLERITPPWLNFKVLRTSMDDVREGTLIDYKLRIHGIPVKWRTLIKQWQPNEKFVDTQIRGPYRL